MFYQLSTVRSLRKWRKLATLEVLPDFSRRYLHHYITHELLSTIESFPKPQDRNITTTYLPVCVHVSGELFPLAAGGFDRRRRSHVDLFGDDLLAGAAAAAGGGGGGTVE